MRWLTNFYDLRFKWTATAAIGIHPTKPDCYSWWISEMQSGREDTLEERYAIVVYIHTSICNYNTYTHTHTPTYTHTLTTKHKRNPICFLSVFCRILIFNSFHLLNCLMLFCKKLHETQGCRIFSMDYIYIYIYISVNVNENYRKKLNKRYVPEFARDLKKKRWDMKVTVESQKAW